MTLKRKPLKANNASHVPEFLRKTITRRSYLKKVYFKNCTENSLKAFIKQKSFCNGLYKKRNKFFNNLNLSFVIYDKLFWKTIKPFFTNKGNHGSNIQIVEDKESLQDNQKITGELNSFFKFEYK